MASASYGGFVLTSVITILLSLQYFTANAHEGNIGTKRKWLKGSETGKDVSLDVFDHVINLGGRKMLQGLDKKPSHVSAGKNKADDLEYPQDARSSSKNVFTKHEHIEKDDEDTKAFLEAADEVANLMRKDYKGANRPKRKPPINNHEPTH